MEIRQLKTFLVVAQTLHFTRAAEKLHLAQSSVSAQIHALEDDLGVRLFDRIGRRVLLTDAGERLLAYARRVQDMTEEIRTEVRGAANPRGSLTIRVPESLAETVMPEVVERYCSEYPEVSLHFINCTDQRLKQELESGRLDLAFLIIDTLHFGQVNTEVLRPEPLVMAASPDHPLATMEQITPVDLAKHRLLLPRTD